MCFSSYYHDYIRGNRKEICRDLYGYVMQLRNVLRLVGKRKGTACSSIEKTSRSREGSFKTDDLSLVRGKDTETFRESI